MASWPSAVCPTIGTAYLPTYLPSSLICLPTYRGTYLHRNTPVCMVYMSVLRRAAYTICIPISLLRRYVFKGKSSPFFYPHPFPRPQKECIQTSGERRWKPKACCFYVLGIPRARSSSSLHNLLRREAQASSRSPVCRSTTTSCPRLRLQHPVDPVTYLFRLVDMYAARSSTTHLDLILPT